MAQSHFIEVDGLRLHYLEDGAGDPVLLLHGWPTSSFLWRNVIGPIAENNRVIALDLPGFGQSAKPLDASYSFPFYSRVLDGFLDAIGVDATSLVVHDLGGPVGLYWACHHPQRLRRLALLNTLVYPRMSWAVMLFVAACRTPGLRSLAASPWGLKNAMRIGVTTERGTSEEVMRGVLAPFESAGARRALCMAGSRLHPDGFKEIARMLPSLRVPRAGAGDLRRERPDSSGRREHDAPGRAGPAADRGDGSTRVRALSPGGPPRRSGPTPRGLPGSKRQRRIANSRPVWAFSLSGSRR
jgi:haloalkane dehalogenase